MQAPYLIQGSELPVFRGIPDNNLTFDCKTCGHTLIDGYVAEEYLSVGMQCFRCKNISFTPEIGPGEIFSFKVLSLGHEGAYLMMSTADKPKGLTITCDQALTRAAAETSPRSGGYQLNFSRDGIDELVSQYNDITGGIFSVQYNKVCRTGDREALTFPFSWPVKKIRSIFDNGEVNIDYFQFHISLAWLIIFGDIVFRWKHHPRFLSVARDFGKRDAFLHTSALFIIASYLYNCGNRIGLSLENIHGEANPDLYLAGVRHYDKIYLGRVDKRLQPDA